MRIIKEFNYSIRPGKMALPALLFIAAAVVLFREAITNDRGLIINGVIKLNEGQATLFFYILAGLSCLFVIAAIIAAINGALVKEKLTVYSDGFAFPVRKETLRLYFRNITSLRVLDIYRTRFIEFVTSENKKYALPDTKLGTKAEFDEVYGLLSAGVKNGQIAD